MEYVAGPVLGIETSCDDTSAAIVVGKRILSNVVSSQADLQKKWGGIVPEAAARSHTEAMLPAISEALRGSAVGLTDLTGIAVTNRPGLVGALSVGVTTAKALSLALGIPLVGVHHLESHTLSPLIESDVPFPHVCLLVSGGHTELILVKRPGVYSKLGGTIDDAAGEAFDKAARTLGLGYPGGPAIQETGAAGDAKRYSLPRGLKDPSFNFSFSGLKTAVMLLAEREGEALDRPSAAASFEATVAEVLSHRAIFACRETGARAVTLVGGVAANLRLRATLARAASEARVDFFVPGASLCTDNAAMVAHVGAWRLSTSRGDDFDLDTEAVSSLPTGEAI